MEPDRKHWGDWVRARIFFLGFRSQKIFAQVVGCEQNQLCRWLKMEQPPTMMRRGLDLSLARELRTDPFTLFTKYQQTTPDSAPVLSQTRPVAA
jgi:hypothetical protein